MATGICKDARLVFKGEMRFLSCGKCLDRDGVLFPRFPAIERTADEDTVAPCIVRPIRGTAEMIECQIAKKRMALVVERGGHVAGDAPAGRVGTVRNLERSSRISRICSGCRALIFGSALEYGD